MLCPLNGNLGNFHYLAKDSTVDSHVYSVGLLSVFVKGLFLGPPFRNSTQLHVSVSNRSFSEFGGRMRLKVDIEHAMQSDDVTDTVSYAEVYETVKKEMEIPSKLLEHVGGRIVKRLFGDFPPIEDIELKLSKRNPPMGADIEAAGIEIHTSRQQQ